MVIFRSPTIFLVLLYCWVAQGETLMKYKDSNQPLNVRINDLLRRMTLAEKIGQMSQIESSAGSAEDVKDYFIVSVLSDPGVPPRPQASAENWVNMVNEFQKGALSTRLGIPLLYGIDAIHGHNNVYNSTIFPHNIGLGATRDPGLVRKIGEATALEVRATCIPYVFAPCISVCRDPRWGRCYESYSEDTKVVQEMTEIISGLQGEASSKGVPFVAGKRSVAACSKHFVGDGGTVQGINENNTVIKHFVGDGGTVQGINENNTVINQHGLLSIHKPPYYNSIIKGVSTIMVSYSSWNGQKMHANHYLLTDFLKNKLRFRGFIISDYKGLDWITSPPHANYSHSVQAGIQAGIDMVMIADNYTEFINILTYQVQNNIIPMSRINDVVRRILRVKFIIGLFENPYADYSLVGELGNKEHRDLAREAVRKSLVLLKNGKDPKIPLLPLPKNTKKILVAGSHVDNLGYQCGGWTIDWQGLSGNNNTVGTPILEAIKKTVDPGTKTVYSEIPEPDFVKNGGLSYAIVVVGELPYAETVGDNMNLTIAAPGPRTINIIDALVAAWLPGTEGQGVADELFGDYGFSGKLSRTWFRSVDQLPMNVGDRHYDPLFPFGFGLTTEVAKSS